MLFMHWENFDCVTTVGYIIFLTTNFITLKYGLSISHKNSACRMRCINLNVYQVTNAQNKMKTN